MSPQEARPEQLAAALRELVATLQRESAPERTVYETLLRSPSLTIQHVVLPPSVAASPHDHCMPAVVGVYAGAEKNVFYDRRDDGTLVARYERTVVPGEVITMDSDTIHAIVNPTSGYTAAVHAYCGDLFATSRSRWNGAQREALDERVQEALAAAAQSEECRLGRGLTEADVQDLLGRSSPR